MQAITALADSGYTSFGAVLAVVAGVTAGIAKFLRFREDFFYPRELLRLERLRIPEGDNSLLKDSIDLALDEQRFRMLFGRSGSKSLRSAFCSEYEKGELTRFQLRSSSHFLVVDDSGALKSTYGVL